MALLISLKLNYWLMVFNMPRCISRQTILKSIVTAVCSAQDLYTKWTHDQSWLGYAPEYLLTCEIARKVAETEQCYIALEASVSQTMKKAGAIRPGPLPKEMRPRGRFDIVVYQKNEAPSYIIEVKSPVYTYDQIAKDIQRLACVLERNAMTGGSIKNCIVACYLWSDNPQRRFEDASERLEALAERLHKRCSENITNCSVAYEIGDTNLEDDGAWLAAVYSISKAS